MLTSPTGLDKISKEYAKDGSPEMKGMSVLSHQYSKGAVKIMGSRMAVDYECLI